MTELLENSDNTNESAVVSESPANEATISLAAVQALADALQKIESYTPTVWVDNESPDIDAAHLNKAEQAIMRVTTAMNSAVDVIKDLQSQVNTTNNNLSNRFYYVPNNETLEQLMQHITQWNRPFMFEINYTSPISPAKNNVVGIAERGMLHAFDYSGKHFYCTDASKGWQASPYALKSDLAAKTPTYREQHMTGESQALPSDSSTTLWDSEITIPFDCIMIGNWKVLCRSSNANASFYYMVNNAYVQGRVQWDGTVQTDNAVNIFVMNKFTKGTKLDVAVQGNCSIRGNNSSLTRYTFTFIPV